MIRYRSEKQRTLDGFETPFQVALDAENRWVKLSECIPWDELAEGYYAGLSLSRGRPAKDARLVIAAVIIKHKLCLSDEETVQQIQENPYLQYFAGLPGFTNEAPFAPALFVEIRKRMSQAVFESFHQSIVDAVQLHKPGGRRGTGGSATPSKEGSDRDEDPPGGGVQDKSTVELVEPAQGPDRHGKLILDATVAEQAIRYPTDLSLLNEARQFSEQIIDLLYPRTGWARKPRTYRQKARQSFLAVAKQRRAGHKVRRRAIKEQLQYLRRNLGHIARLMDTWPMGTPIPLPRWLLHRYWVIQHLYDQQWQMYRANTRRCAHRIVSISQPHVRPIVRGKQDKAVEFGAKLSVSLDGQGLARIDHLRWDAFHEGHDLPAQVEAYRRRCGHYPDVVLADPLYGTRANRRYLKALGIRFAGKPLGRPKKLTEENREELQRLKTQRREEYLQRIPIEGKFGQGKNGYRLNYIRAKRADTSAAWINSIFLVMNLLVLLRAFFALCFRAAVGAISDLTAIIHQATARIQ